MQRHLAGGKFSLRFTFERTDSVRGVTSTFHCVTRHNGERTDGTWFVHSSHGWKSTLASFAEAKYVYDADNSNGMEKWRARRRKKVKRSGKKLGKRERERERERVERERGGTGSDRITERWASLSLIRVFAAATARHNAIGRWQSMRINREP